MTIETLEFLAELVNNITIQVGHPQFDRDVARIMRAKAELEAELATVGEEDSA
jgi:hypothetical protein